MASIFSSAINTLVVHNLEAICSAANIRSSVSAMRPKPSLTHHPNSVPQALTLHIPPQSRELSQGLGAFWANMNDFQHRLTIVTMTEFGRRLEENANAGTDHGSASLTFALAGAVNGGWIYGKWPGLRPRDLRAGDLTVTTDYRQVLLEVLMARGG